VSESPYLYLTIAQIRELHDSVIQEYGGTDGLRGLASLGSIVEAPQNVAYFQDGDVFAQASAYAYAIVQNNPFMDGNKRTALVAALVFLEINGITEHDYNESLLVQAIWYLAEGKMNVGLFAQFLRDALSGTMGTWEDEVTDR
jgi:death on curing protein